MGVHAKYDRRDKYRGDGNPYPTMAEKKTLDRNYKKLMARRGYILRKDLKGPYRRYLEDEYGSYSPQIGKDA